MPACLLAFDTSTDQTAAALLAPGGPWLLNEAGGALASTRLIPALMGLLARAGITLADVQAIGFGQGPGAFTGLRTACAVAQGLALARDTPVLALDSLLVVADDAMNDGLNDGLSNGLSMGLNTALTDSPASPLPSAANGAQALGAVPAPLATAPWWVAMDARMDEVYAACYQHGAAGWRVVVEPRLWTLAALSAAWSANPPVRVAGSAVTAFADRLPWGDAQTRPQCSNRAAALGRLAQAAWAQGRAIAADQALPVYLRDKVALTTAERAALRALAACSPAP